MSTISHPVGQEELMAYLDGELPAERAGVIAGHLKQCPECQALAADFRAVSCRMADWAIEASNTQLTDRIIEMNEAGIPRRRNKEDDKLPLTYLAVPRRRAVRWALGLSAAVAAVVIVVYVSLPDLFQSARVAVQSNSEYVTMGPPSDAKAAGGGGGGNEAPAPRVIRRVEPNLLAPSQPMVVRTAQLILVTKDFDGARTSVERIVREHQGYVAKLDVTAAAGAARTLTATLRIPAAQLATALSELKQLGRVAQESQNGEEVTQQYIDLNARLSNARVTEQRLDAILRDRTGKVSDVLEVEQEIARVRGEIERMEAERKNLENRVTFATVEVTVNEEYKAQMEITPPSTGRKLWNAAVDGYHGLAETILGLTMALLQYGPTLLFWAALLFWPARLAWRKMRTLNSN